MNDQSNNTRERNMKETKTQAEASELAKKVVQPTREGGRNPIGGPDASSKFT